jgi:hypothetical protein
MQDLSLKSFSYELQFDMHFYMHSYLHKIFIVVKSGCYNMAELVCCLHRPIAYHRQMRAGTSYQAPPYPIMQRQTVASL